MSNRSAKYNTDWARQNLSNRMHRAVHARNSHTMQLVVDTETSSLCMFETYVPVCEQTNERETIRIISNHVWTILDCEVSF